MSIHSVTADIDFIIPYFIKQRFCADKGKAVIDKIA